MGGAIDSELLGDDTMSRQPTPALDDPPMSGARGTAGTALSRRRRRDSSPIGRTLRGSYRVIRPLDVGGMAIIYEAEHVRLERLVAVKFLCSEIAADSAMGLRFRREAEALARLNHPHIVKVIDFDTTESGEPFLVMELLRGETLAARLERDCSFGLRDALTIAAQLASGLAAAHQAEVVHRDLKPANVFLEAIPGQAPVVKLLDFGISKIASPRQLLTREHMVLGTPEYMAPEQASGSTGLVDHRADQYSLAAIVYEMLCGRPPFPSGDDVGALLRRVINEPPEPLIELAPWTGAVSNVVMRALSKEPRGRYRSIREFADTLECAGARELARGGGEPKAPSLLESPGTARMAAEVRALAQAAQTAFDRGNLNEAALLAEAVVDLTKTAPDARVVTAIARFSELLEKILIARLGGISRMLGTSARLPPPALLKLTPEEAFLLSRIDDGLTLEETLDVSAMPRLRTLRLLVRLMRAGALTPLDWAARSCAGSVR